MESVLPHLVESFDSIMTYTTVQFVYTNREHFNYIRYKLKTTQIPYEPEANYGKFAGSIPRPRPWSLYQIFVWLVDILYGGQPLALIEYIFQFFSPKDQTILAHMVLDDGAPIKKGTFELLMNFGPNYESLEKSIKNLVNPYEGLEYFIKKKVTSLSLLAVLKEAIRVTKRQPPIETLDLLSRAGYKFVARHVDVLERSLMRIEDAPSEDFEKLIVRNAYPNSILDKRKSLKNDRLKIAQSILNAIKTLDRKYSFVYPAIFLTNLLRYKGNQKLAYEVLKFFLKNDLFDEIVDGGELVYLYYSQDSYGDHPEILEDLLGCLSRYVPDEETLEALRLTYGEWSKK